MNAEGKDGRTTSATTFLLGTAVTGIATAVVVSAGCVALWMVVLHRLPWPLALVAIVGLALAPLRLALDLVVIDRTERPPPT